MRSAPPDEHFFPAAGAVTGPTTPPAPTGEDVSAGTRSITVGLLVVLGLLSAIAPFATDLYLPAFPLMTTALDTSATWVQLTLTAFLGGVAAGQLVFGPLSDRVGRMPPLVAGAVLCVAASVVAALAPTVEVLVAARFVQGLAGAAGMVIGRAIVSDLATGRTAARAFSLMMIVGGIAPVVAPVVGSLLMGPLGWRGLLGVVLALTVLMLVAVLAVVRETLPRERRTARAARTVAGRSGLGSRTFWGSTVAFTFAFAVMMAYISASPFLYQQMMGLGAVQYGLLFGLNALALGVVSGISGRLTATRSVPGLLRAGLVTVLVATVALAVLVAAGVPAGWYAVPIFVAVAALGLVMGNATALALGAVPHAAGTASALLGAAQFALAGAVSPLVSIGGEGTAAPLAAVMVTAALIALAGHLLSGAGRGDDAAARA